ncbi:30S ribosomal protein S17 [Candidatus Peregrinibacteria bacterium RIFCSPLOWO2_01_FULL_39_12]|nr:MAG: 30S ribosomal protein S17 [Candidatus Peregrinibacteria bacterium RIFCSPLOWO2_01_FULL_39_12]OGJ43405.1 MAG: 30S ribosomal protein S17 [Candidatus Peregrinibacteria bacterium RIFCSPLOWO2_02_FULL_39_10]
MRYKKAVISSNKQQKTLVVRVDSYKIHPKYKKKFKVSKKFYVDNPENKKFEIGDEVTIYETKPLSKLKRWTIIQPNNQQK